MNCACGIILIRKNSIIPIGKKTLQIGMIELSRIGQVAPQFPMHIFDYNKTWIGTAVNLADYVTKWNLLNPLLPQIEIFEGQIITDELSVVTELYGDYIMLYLLPDDTTEASVLDNDGNYIFNSETILY
jgi:hypothetical protein